MTALTNFLKVSVSKFLLKQTIWWWLKYQSVSFEILKGAEFRCQAGARQFIV